MPQPAAELIARHRLERVPLPVLGTALRPLDIESGYRLQDEVNDILSAAGLGPVVGHKVGCTNPVLQARIGIHHPMAGAIFARTVHRGEPVVSHADFVRLGVECEVVFLLGQDLPARALCYDRPSVSAAVSAIAVGMELIDDRYASLQTIDAPTLIADDALDAGAVIGEPLADWRALDLPTLAGRTEVNGRVAGRGSGADVLGNPLDVLVWLANQRSARGLGLRAGEFVFTGSMVDIVWVRPGDRVTTAVEGLGQVSIAVV